MSIAPSMIRNGICDEVEEGNRDLGFTATRFVGVGDREAEWRRSETANTLTVPPERICL